MKKFLRKVVKSFKKLAEANLLTFSQNVATSMANAIAEFPTPTPPLADINTAIGIYAELLQAAAGRDKVQVVMKNLSKQNLLLLLSQLADYVNLTAQGAEDLLAKSGFTLNKVPEPVALDAPGYVVLLDGGGSGELTFKFRRVKGASSYLYQYTSDASLANESWVSIPATTTSYTFTGLTSGTTYYCRVVAVGSYQQQKTSIVLNRISQ
ncbi:fibronectin type III domain-containing protein [Ginsengibacter hankyongi]|uniref:Fibronectin type III domain-containing protein n=1 Tax=Ginsengibacter hankyongi TaxID=2607284 RepID=A0A5J5IGI7_9BACT|nr:fibronectin type III domain-containing protein [Ginsengibacter hankyongi]KAA9037254.1 fibronectin type III domain-containing protein [Ginsengibacter hankyongi]